MHITALIAFAIASQAPSLEPNNRCAQVASDTCETGKIPNLAACGLEFRPEVHLSRTTSIFVLDDTRATNYAVVADEVPRVDAWVDRWANNDGIAALTELDALSKSKKNIQDRVALWKLFYVKTRQIAAPGALRPVLEIGDIYADAAHKGAAHSYYDCGKQIVRDQSGSPKVENLNDIDHRIESLERLSTDKYPLIDYCFRSRAVCESEINGSLRPIPPPQLPPSPPVTRPAMVGWYTGVGVSLALSVSFMASGGWTAHHEAVLTDKANGLAATKDASPAARDEYRDVIAELDALDGRAPRLWAAGSVLGGLSVIALAVALGVDCKHHVVCRAIRPRGGRSAPAPHIQPWISRSSLGLTLRF